MRPWPSTRFIYAVQEQRRNGLIKIGTANNLTNRLREVGKQTPHGIDLLGVTVWHGEHARLAEAMIHHHLSAYRVRPHQMARRNIKAKREWFHPKPEVLEWVEGATYPLEVAMTLEPRRLTSEPVEELGPLLPALDAPNEFLALALAFDRNRVEVSANLSDEVPEIIVSEASSRTD
jgi:T5orf172 domain